MTIEYNYKLKHINIKGLINSIGIFLVLSYVYFYQLSDAVLGSHISVAILVIGMIALLPKQIAQDSNIKVRIKLENFSLVVLLSLFFFHNSLNFSDSMMTLLTFLLIVTLFLVMKSAENWMNTIISKMCLFGMIHIFATLLFAIIPKVSEVIMFPIWYKTLGALPTGTEEGLYAYRAGITMHYSSNGIYCAITSICCLSKFFINKRRAWLLYTLISFIALLLTTKRGPLIFVAFSGILTYIVANPHRRFGRAMKAAFTILITLIAFYVISDYIPVLSDLKERFIGPDGYDINEISSDRIAYWTLAYKYFLDKPFIGIGWYGFRSLYNVFIYSGSIVQASFLDAHNVYIQLLCETGIIGLIAYLMLTGYTLGLTVRLVRKCYDQKLIYYECLVASFAIQVFYLAYSLTGNCLYDFSLSFYVISCAIIYYISRNVNKGATHEREQNRDLNVTKC